VADSAKEFFDTLPSRVDSSKLGGIDNSYLFDVTGAGTWLVDVRNGALTVTEGGADADTTITVSEENFLKLASGKQNPMTAYMTGKIKVKGDMGAATKLQKIFG
jgi:putative sterol carrier protein